MTSAENHSQVVSDTNEVSNGERSLSISAFQHIGPRGIKEIDRIQDADDAFYDHSIWSGDITGEPSVSIDRNSGLLQSAQIMLEKKKSKRTVPFSVVFDQPHYNTSLIEDGIISTGTANPSIDIEK